MNNQDYNQEADQAVNELLVSQKIANDNKNDVSLSNYLRNYSVPDIEQENMRQTQTIATQRINNFHNESPLQVQSFVLRNNEPLQKS